MKSSEEIKATIKNDMQICVCHFFCVILQANWYKYIHENNTFSFWNAAGGDQDGATGKEVTE